MGFACAEQEFSAEDWAMNCAQLAKVYADNMQQFAIAHYLMLAADAVATRCQPSSQACRDTRSGLEVSMCRSQHGCSDVWTRLGPSKASNEQRDHELLPLRQVLRYLVKVSSA